MLAGKRGEAAFDFAPDASHGDAEDALAALDQVDDFVRGGALVDAGAVAHQRDLGKVLHAALTQVLDGGTDLLEGNSSVEEALDHLEHQDVTEAVKPLRAGSGSTTDGGLDQSGAGPVIQLAVGD